MLRLRRSARPRKLRLLVWLRSRERPKRLPLLKESDRKRRSVDLLLRLLSDDRRRLFCLIHRLKPSARPMRQLQRRRRSARKRPRRRRKWSRSPSPSMLLLSSVSKTASISPRLLKSWKLALARSERTKRPSPSCRPNVRDTHALYIHFFDSFPYFCLFVQWRICVIPTSRSSRAALSSRSCPLCAMICLRPWFVIFLRSHSFSLPCDVCCDVCIRDPLPM